MLGAMSKMLENYIKICASTKKSVRKDCEMLQVAFKLGDIVALVH